MSDSQARRDDMRRCRWSTPIRPRLETDDRRPSSSPRTRVVKRAADPGPVGLEERVAAAWQPFCDWIAVRLEPIPGTDCDAYLDALDGRVAPDRAQVPSLA